MVTKEPDAEVSIDVDLVRKLINEQIPELSKLELSFLDSGWDNENYRLGSEYLVRLPRRKVAVKLLQNEMKWLSQLKGELPINIPAPVHMGKPTDYYPWPWSINPWFEGKTADLNKASDKEAGKLVSFLKNLHTYEAHDGPENILRGVSLKLKEKNVNERLARLKTKTDLITPKIEKQWADALLEKAEIGNNLIHGDLHPRNIIVNSGQIEAIVDWGDITTGDVATDLATFWMIFEDEEVRIKALKQYGASDSLIKRSRGWAIFFGSVLLETGLNSNTQHANIGKFILENISRETQS